MVSDDSTTTLLAPLETHVKAQVQHLTAVAGVVRELHSTEQQYANEYAELPVGVPESAKLTLEQLPQLREACDDFSLFVRKCSAIKAAVAQDLAKEVIAPLESFTADHAEKAQHLLSELYELLQKEKAFDLAYENLREGCKEDQAAATESSQDETEHQAHMEQLLRKRDAERLAIQQWITALHFAGQRYEAHVRHVLRQTIAMYSRMIASMTALVGEFQEQRLSRETDGTNVAIGVNDNNSDVATEEAWESFMAGYECHVTMTGWMSELFKQMIPAEHKTAKCLQTSVKLDRAVCRSFDGVGLGAPLSGLIQFHGLLTVNIANPIIRTLKFSRARQERMRNELSRTLDETRMLVGSARTRLEASAAKAKAEEEETPVRCDSLTSSETSDCGLEENNESEQNTLDAAAQEQVSVESIPEQVHLEAMERKLALQQQELARALEQTSFLAVKTMELMMQDHVKHVTKALTTLKEAIRTELPQTQRRTSDAAKQPWKLIAERLSIKVSDQRELHAPVDQLEERQPRSESQENNVAVHPPVARRRRKNRAGVCGGVREPSAVQVALSFLQSAVGVVCWAAVTGFKAVETLMPHSFQERVALVLVVTAVLMLVSVCVKSSELQSSWSELTNAQHTTTENLVQIVKLSLEVCGQQVAAAPTRLEGS